MRVDILLRCLYAWNNTLLWTVLANNGQMANVNIVPVQLERYQLWRHSELKCNGTEHYSEHVSMLACWYEHLASLKKLLASLETPHLV